MNLIDKYINEEDDVLIENIEKDMDKFLDRMKKTPMPKDKKKKKQLMKRFKEGFKTWWTDISDDDDF